MPSPVSNILSFMANELKAFLVAEIPIDASAVHIGSPADTTSGGADAVASLNLFFYRIEPSGFYPDTTTLDPFYVRVQCLITGFGKETNISEGEINLRLIGGVLRAFHEHPVQHIKFTHPNGDIINTALQVILRPLSSDEINQIWSTQGDITYRTSVAYELALAPITPLDTKPDPVLVGSALARAKPTIKDPPSVAIGAATGLALNFTGAGSEIHRTVTGTTTATGYVPSPASLELEYTKDAAGSAPHELQLFEKTQTGFEKVSTATPFGGAATTTHDFALPARTGEFILLVESVLGEDTARSNVISFSLIDGGGA